MCEICVADAAVGSLAAGTVGGSVWYARYRIAAGARAFKAWIRKNILKLG